MSKAYEIQVSSLKKSFGNTDALKGLSLQFSSGPMHGIIGPEGAGKTTLLRLMLGLLRPTAGAITYFEDKEKVAFESIRSSIAYMPQQQSLYADLSISEHLAFFKDLYGIGAEQYKQRRQELLSITRLDAFVDRPAGKLSGGMYKKLGLMCALLRSPTIILLDEPTNGVDPISRREFWELLYRLCEQNILIIITTSYMDEAERCGEVHLLEEGRLLDFGAPRDLLRNADVKSFDDLFLKRGQQ